MMEKICVVGLGYIGLPTSVMFALNGYKVIGVDINEKIVNLINKGEVPIVEPYLGKVVKSMVDSKGLTAKTEPEYADVFIIAVPTPITENKSCDLSYVLSAVDSILPYIQKNNIVIIESTIPPRTTEDIIKPLIEKIGRKVGEDVYLAHCPERVLPGKILKEMVENNRIVGGCTKKCGNKASEIYKCFVSGEILVTDAKTAEMTKLIENTFRDVNIGLANEVIKICNMLKINGLEVIDLANKHPRVKIHQPGPGVGGHCLAVDPYFIFYAAPQHARIISTARDINSHMPSYIVSKVKELVDEKDNPKVALFGISYKGNVDDLRESPGLEIMKLLQSDGFEVAIFDPYVKDKELKLTTIDRAVENADIILILADHDDFKKVDYEELVNKMRKKIILDTKNILSTNHYDSEKITIKNLGNLFD